MSASRRFVDSFGFSWHAMEIARGGGPDTRATATNWLYFLSRGTTRRLHSYPRDWAAMGWADLEDLCTRAEVVGTDAGSRHVRALAERLTATVR